MGTRLKSRGDADVVAALACVCVFELIEFVLTFIVSRSCSDRATMACWFVSLDSRMCRAAILLYVLLS